MMIPIISNTKCESDEIEDRVNHIFELMIFEDKECEMVNIRKQQIINHHYVNDIVESIEGCIDLLGKEVVEVTSKLEYYNDRLMSIHSPILISDVKLPIAKHYLIGKEYLV